MIATYNLPSWLIYRRIKIEIKNTIDQHGSKVVIVFIGHKVDEPGPSPPFSHVARFYSKNATFWITLIIVISVKIDFLMITKLNKIWQ